MPATKAQKERVIALLNAISDLHRGDLLAVLGFSLDDADGPAKPVQFRMGGEFAHHLEGQLGQLISLGEKLTTTDARAVLRDSQALAEALRDGAIQRA
jgi:hypothetical protein